AVTGPGTKLAIPVDNSKGSLGQSFIKFVKNDQNGKITNSKPFTVNGINIEMDLTLTPDAEVSLIFNEAKGDIIRGRGRGNLKIDITRQGAFDIFGEYEIEQGEYLFTVPGLPVAKPFVVERGGIVRWTGDPVNTSLNITANYRTRTSIKPFIEEYLTLSSPETQRLAEQRSEVDLRLILGGTLFKPEIKFDLTFPNLTSDISSFADSKLRLLRTNELELNSQVLGLIVFNSFLPSSRVSDVFGASGLQSAGINTLSEFISSQLSLILTNLINSTLEDNGLISGVDFEVGVRNNNLALGSAATSNLFPDEIEVRLKNKFRFMDERLSLNLGGNYVFQNQGQAVNQVLPDFAIELELTNDRKLKVRLYGKGDIDPTTLTSLRQKYGLGVAYRTEFGSMLDFEKKMKTKIGDLIEK
ncbi:MAG TPA: translocation/assembly module TamB domain-containing protein, partial [Saprospiraceae bacterium]|nr:translocation/assembly module TamB domain-containing protein [Saprospiraceae bacterium]